MAAGKLRQGEIWRVRWNGADTPCVVLSPPELLGLDTIIVAPVGSEAAGYQGAPFRQAITVQDESGWILLDQLSNVPAEALVERLGTVPPRPLKLLLARTRELFE